MKKGVNAAASWTSCPECQGRGKKSRGLPKKVRLQYQRTVEQFEKSNGEGTAPVRPKGHLHTCLHCNESGLLPSASPPVADKKKYSKVFEKVKSENCIVHCGSGVTACHTLLSIAYAGLEIPKLHVGS